MPRRKQSDCEDCSFREISGNWQLGFDRREGPQSKQWIHRRNTTPVRRKHPQQRRPSVLAAFVNQVLDFQSVQLIAFAQLPNGSHCFTDGMSRYLLGEVLCSFVDKLLYVDFDGDTFLASLFCDVVRNLDSNLHRNIISRRPIPAGCGVRTNGTDSLKTFTEFHRAAGCCSPRVPVC